MLKYKAYQAVLYEHSFTKSKLTRAEKLDKNYSKYALQPHIDEKLEVLHPSYIRNKRNQARFEKARQEMFDIMKRNLEKLDLACTREIHDDEIEKVLDIFSSNRAGSSVENDDTDNVDHKNKDVRCARDTKRKTIARNESVVLTEDQESRDNIDNSSEMQKSDPSFLGSHAKKVAESTTGPKNEETPLEVLTKLQVSVKNKDLSPDGQEYKKNVERKESEKYVTENVTAGPQIPIIKENSELIQNLNSEEKEVDTQ